MMTKCLWPFTSGESKMFVQIWASRKRRRKTTYVYVCVYIYNKWHITWCCLSLCPSVIICPQEVSDDINTFQFLTTLPWQQEEKVSSDNVRVHAWLCVWVLLSTSSSLAFTRSCLAVTTRGQCAPCCRPSCCSLHIVSRNPWETVGKCFPNMTFLLLTASLLCCSGIKNIAIYMTITGSYFQLCHYLWFCVYCWPKIIQPKTKPRHHKRSHTVLCLKQCVSVDLTQLLTSQYWTSTTGQQLNVLL